MKEISPVLVLHAAEMAERLSTEADKWPTGGNNQSLYQGACDTLRALLRANGYGPGAGDTFQPEPSQRWCILPSTYVRELRYRAEGIVKEMEMLRRRTRALERLAEAAMDQPNPYPALRDALIAITAPEGA